MYTHSLKVIKLETITIGNFSKYAPLQANNTNKKNTQTKEKERFNFNLFIFSRKFYKNGK